MKKLLVMAAAGLVGVLVFAAAASAASIDLGRFGRFRAHGHGAAHLTGGGYVRGTLDAGTLIVHGDLEDVNVELEGRGHRHRIENGFVFEGVHGKFRLLGRALVVNIAGAGANIYAAGHWDIELKGAGSYETSNGQSGRWSGGVVSVSGDVESAIAEGESEE